MQGIEDLRLRIGADVPSIVITDRDERMRASILANWPSTKLQLCLFHVDKNVQTNLAKKWRKSATEEAAIEDQATIDLTVDLEVDNQGQEAGPQGQGEAAAQGQQDPAAQGRQDTPEAHNNGPIAHNQDGFMALWRRIVYAATQGQFLEA